MNIGFVLLAGVPALASASVHLRCQLTQGSEVQVLDFRPTRDPYNVKAVDIRGNFRFKAVVVGDETSVEYIDLYAYYWTRRQAILLHQAHYSAPAAGRAPDAAALTGTNHLYSPELGRELQYGCALMEGAP